MHTLSRGHCTQSIQYVDAPCGAGKTRSAEDYVGELAQPSRSGRKFIIKQPNTGLINQTAANIRRRHPAVPLTIIHTETHRGDVVRAIDTHAKNARPGGEVLLVTQQAFARLGHFRNAQDWHLVIDEIPQVHVGYNVRLAHNNYQLTQFIRAEPHDDVYVRLTGTDAALLDAVAANKDRDGVWGLFSDLVAKTQHPDWQVYCPAEMWERFLHNAESGAEITDLEAFALLDPTASGPRAEWNSPRIRASGQAGRRIRTDTCCRSTMSPSAPGARRSATARTS